MMIICQLNIFLHVLNATIYWHIPWNIYCRPACCAWEQEPWPQAALAEFFWPEPSSPWASGKIGCQIQLVWMDRYDH